MRRLSSAGPDVARAIKTSAGKAAAKRIRYGPLEHWVGFHLRMAQTASFQSFARLANGVKLPRPGWFATLTLIGANPGISQTGLSRADGRDKSTLTPVLG